MTKLHLKRMLFSNCQAIFQISHTIRAYSLVRIIYTLYQSAVFMANCPDLEHPRVYAMNREKDIPLMIIWLTPPAYRVQHPLNYLFWHSCLTTLDGKTHVWLSIKPLAYIYFTYIRAFIHCLHYLRTFLTYNLRISIRRMPPHTSPEACTGSRDNVRQGSVMLW